MADNSILILYFFTPGIINRKLEQQFIGPLKVTQQVGRLAYKLDISNNWKIYNIISIAHLEPAPPNNPFKRLILDHPSAITLNSKLDFYIIERLLNKRS